MKKIILIVILFYVGNTTILAQEEYKTYWDREEQNLRTLGSYLNDEKTGLWVSYNKSGKTKSVGSYINGEKTGQWKYYYNNKQLSLIEHFKNGISVGERKDYYRNGQLSYRMNYNKKGEPIGEAKSYNIKGKLIFVTTYKNGEIYKSKHTDKNVEEFSTYQVGEIEKQKIEKIIGTSLKSKLITKTDSKSNYTYVFGSKEQIYDNKKINAFTIILLKNKKVQSEISFNIQFEFMTITQVQKIVGYNLENTNETIEIGFGRAACGYGMHSAIFFRKDDNLIKGLITSSYGEPESEYSYSNIIAPPENKKNQIWIEETIGHSETINEEIVEVNYYTEIRKYELKNEKLILLNPKKLAYYYVTAKSGLRQRYRPFITSEKLPLLKYGTKIKVLNKTELSFKVKEEGKIISGHWVNIETKDEQGNEYTSYVFDGYLSKIKSGND